MTSSTRVLTVVVETGDPVVVRPDGEVDRDCADALRATLLEQVGSADVVLDLGRVAFIDSSGVSVLITAQRAAESAGHRFTIRGVDGVVLKVITALGLERVLPLDPQQ